MYKEKEFEPPFNKGQHLYWKQKFNGVQYGTYLGPYKDDGSSPLSLVLRGNFVGVVNTGALHAYTPRKNSKRS